MYVTNEEPSVDCNKCRDYSEIFLVKADHKGVCDIFAAGRKKKCILLLLCTICPKVRFESVHGLGKNAFIAIEEK